MLVLFYTLRNKDSKRSFSQWCHRRTIWSASFATVICPQCTILQSLHCWTATQHCGITSPKCGLGRGPKCLRLPSFHMPFWRPHHTKYEALDCNCTRPSCRPSTFWHLQGLLPSAHLLYLVNWDGVVMIKKEAKSIISSLISNVCTTSELISEISDQSTDKQSLVSK